MRWFTNRVASVAVLSIAFGLLAASASAETGVYQTREEFLIETFDTDSPDSDVVWIDAELRSIATDILGHAPALLRIRYWFDDARTAWIIDEIGKEKPITLGIVIRDGEIEKLNVLQFRETRGWEIRYPFFTKQFSALRLAEDNGLSHRIDGISGATLSVRAATRSATFALVLNDYLQK